MSAIDDQQQGLPLSVIRKAKTDVSDDIVAALPSMRAAVKLCADLAPVDYKVICSELGIDPGQWSRIMNGQAHFPDDKFNLLQDVCGNEVPTRYAALSRGYGLIRLMSRLEVELAEERAKNAELSLKLAHFEEFQRIGTR